MVSCDTTANLWTNLTQIFSATSRARLTDLRRQLQTTTKGSSTCSDYLQRLRQISDELAFIGSPLSDYDLVSSVLNGLDAEFNPFVIAVTTASRHSPLFFSDLHGLLLSHEHLLQGQSNDVSIPSLETPAAFVFDLPIRGIIGSPLTDQDPLITLPATQTLNPDCLLPNLNQGLIITIKPGQLIPIMGLLLSQGPIIPFLKHSSGLIPLLDRNHSVRFA